jgi:hypothetical protein
MKIEWSGFGVGPKEIIEKSVRECAYDYYERHNISRNDIKILRITHTDIERDGILYEAEIEYDETKLTEDALSWAGIGNR